MQILAGGTPKQEGLHKYRGTQETASGYGGLPCAGCTFRKGPGAYCSEYIYRKTRYWMLEATELQE